MYFAVTDMNCVFVYDYDAESGQIFNKRVFAADCHPDGITVDNKGNVWVTDCKLKGPLICYSPSGEILQKYYFPVRRITSVGFGKKEKNTLFITTAHEGAPVGDYDGGVFMLENVAKSSAEYFGKVKW
jgi:sugar lactone lactonase YvrE